MDYISKLSLIRDALKEAIRKASDENYIETKEGYTFKVEEENEFIAVLNNENVEFRIPTLKWVPGSYEPIEGSELYIKISNEELKNLTEEEIVNRLTQIIDKLKNHKD